MTVVPLGAGIRGRPWDAQKIPTKIGGRVPRKVAAEAQQDHWAPSSSKIGAHVSPTRQPVPIGHSRRQYGVHGLTPADETFNQWQTTTGSHYQQDALGPVDINAEKLRLARGSRAHTSPPEDKLRWPGRVRNERTTARAESLAKVEREHAAALEAPPGSSPGKRPVYPEELCGKRSKEVTEPPQRAGNPYRSAKATEFDEARKLRELYQADRDAFEAIGAEKHKPTRAELIDQAVDELMRRKPGMSRREAIRLVGDELAAQLNSGNTQAANHYKIRCR